MEFSTKIYWNARLAASDFFHIVCLHTHFSSFNSIIAQMSEKLDSSKKQ